jgi:hypothetical protein
MTFYKDIAKIRIDKAIIVEIVKIRALILII